MPTILQLRRGTTAENAAYTGSVGEITVDTTLDKVILHDGSTAGGTTVGNLQGVIQLGKTATGEIDTSSGNLTIDSAGGTVAIDDNATVSGTLGVTGVATFSTHVAMGDSDILKIGAGPDLTLYHDGTNSYITNSTGALKVATETSGVAITLGHSTSEVTVADNLTVTGNLTVSGTTTTVDSTTVNIQNAFVFEGATDDAYETTLTTVDPTADRSVSLPNATDTLVGKATTDTLTNKSIDLADNTLTGSLAEWNSALQSESFVSLTGSETLTNKTLTTPTLTTPVINTGASLKNGSSSAGYADFYEDSDNGTNRVRLIGPASTADVTLTLPASTDTLVGKATTDTFTNKTLTSPVINTAVSGSAILDEDAMGSNSATQLATQQSIKAYVDAKATAADLDLTSDSGTIDIDLDSETLTVAGGTGIDSSATGTTVTVAVDSNVVLLTDSQTLTNKTLTAPTITSPAINTGVSGSAIKDEDNMASDSATHLSTQQSIKAYVDSKVTAEDLDLTTDSGTIDIDLDSEMLTIAGGTGLTSSATGTTATLAIDSTVTTLTGTQTLTNKTLTSAVLTTPQINDTSANHQYVFAVSELAADRTVTLPLLTGNDQVTMDAHATTLTNKTIDLADNTVTGSLAEFNTALQSESFAGLAAAQTLTNKTISGSSNTLSNIANGSLTNSAITVSDGSNTTAVALGGTMTFAGTNNEVEVAESSGTVTIGLPANVTISGNLTVSGDTTTVNTATLAVEDPLISLATGNNAADAVDIGLYGLYDTSGSQDLYGGIFRDAGDGKWKVFKDNQAAPTTTVNTSGTGYAVGTIVANLEATTATLGGVDILSTTNSKTVTNKTINCSNNTISNIVSSMFASAVTLQILDSGGSTVKTIVGSAT